MGKRVRVGRHVGKRMSQIPFCDDICELEVKRVWPWVAFPLSWHKAKYGKLRKSLRVDYSGSISLKNIFQHVSTISE